MDILEKTHFVFLWCKLDPNATQPQNNEYMSKRDDNNNNQKGVGWSQTVANYIQPSLIKLDLFTVALDNEFAF